MESQLATLATDTGTTFAKLFQVEGIQTILFKFWPFRVYTLNNLTPIRLFCVKGRFSGLSGIKTDHVWPEIRPLGFKGLKCHLENVIKKCLQNKPDKHKHNRANRNTFISKTTVNSIIAIISKLMKEEISNSVREAGIYSVQIDSTQDITSTDKCSVILRFVRENVEERLLPIVDRYLATGADLCNLLKEVLHRDI